MHRLLEPSVSDDQLPIVEDEVADQAVQKLGHFDAESLGLLAELLHRLSEAMRALHISAT